jgi:hypothetical protein
MVCVVAGEKPGFSEKTWFLEHWGKMIRVYTPFLIAAALLLTVLLSVCAAPNAPDGHDLAADFAVIVSAAPPAHGTNVWWTDQDAATWTARWAELGPSHVRLFVSHSLVEPVNDNADPHLVNWDGFRFDTPISVPQVMTRTLTYQDWFSALRDQPDINVLIHFSYLAPWLTDNDPHPAIPIPAAPYPPNDLDEYAEFVEATLRYLVETVGFPPQRIAIEVMNEPDLGCGVDPVTPCFWQDWTMADIVDAVRITHEAIQAVDADITLVGLAECCGTGIVRNLLDNYTEGDYLEGLSYHYYASGYDLNAALNRAAALAPYGLPIYLDEYGSRSYLSEGVDGALWHSWALATLWEAGIAPLQYPSSEWIFLGEPYNSMGLFADWRGDWLRKPSYWVYANFFHAVGGGDVISHTAPPGVDVLAVRRVVTGGAQAAFWVVNRGDTALVEQPFTLYNFPWPEATLRVYDNLVGVEPVLTATVSGSPLAFDATLPARSSRAFVLSAEAQHGPLDRVQLTPDPATRVAGQPVVYALTAYDADDNGWDVTISGTYGIEPGAGGGWVGSTYISEVVGSWIVTGSYGGESDTAALTVLLAGVDHVAILPSLAGVAAGESQAYTVEAFDEFDNSLGDVTAATTFTAPVPAGGVWDDNVYTSEVAGAWGITGTYGSVSDTAALTVSHAALDRVVLKPQSAVRMPGDAVAYVLSAYDATTTAGTSPPLVSMRLSRALAETGQAVPTPPR